MEQPSSKALFTPAKTQRASEAIYNQIYPKIISGELRPGDQMCIRDRVGRIWRITSQAL